MARYNVGDVVTYIWRDNTALLHREVGVITNIVRDNKDEFPFDEASTYLVETLGGEGYEITDHDVIQVDNGRQPVQQPVDDIQAPVPDIVAPIIMRPVEPIAQEENWIVGIMDHDDILQGPARPTRRQAIPQPNTINIDGKLIPVVDDRGIANELRVEDYTPTSESTRFVRFHLTVHEGGAPIIITPFLRPDNTMVFCDGGGRRWMNQYMTKIPTGMEVYRDVIQSRWVSERQLVGGFAFPTPAQPKKNKKKLRRKYKSMPVIKDEKHYASKEFIA